MKDLIRKFMVICFVSLLAQSVFAEGPAAEKYWYGKVGAGYTKQLDAYDETNFGNTEWDFKGGPNLRASVGYNSQFWATEIEVSYRYMAMDKRTWKADGSELSYDGDQTQTSFLINGFWFPAPEWTISPYVGLGAGFTHISWNDVKFPLASSAIDDSDIVFTYQLIAGVSYKVTDRLTLEMDYRYFAPLDAEIADASSAVGKMENQELNIFSLALKFKF